MRRIFALILLIEIFASTVNGQLLFYGACPFVKTKQDLDLTKLNLIVYEHSKYFMDTRIYDECNGLHFIADLETVSVTAFKAEFATDFTQTSLGYIEKRNTGNPADIVMDFPLTPNDSINGTVIDTDYSTYLIIYNCEIYAPNPAWHRKWLFLYTASTSPEFWTVLKPLYDKITAAGLLYGYLVPTRQLYCPIYEVDN